MAHMLLAQLMRERFQLQRFRGNNRAKYEALTEGIHVHRFAQYAVSKQLRARMPALAMRNPACLRPCQPSD